MRHRRLQVVLAVFKCLHKLAPHRLEMCFLRPLSLLHVVCFSLRFLRLRGRCGGGLHRGAGAGVVGVGVGGEAEGGGGGGGGEARRGALGAGVEGHVVGLERFAVRGPHL